MSFRLSSLNIRRAGTVGIVCLAFAGIARAAEGMRNIEVVPLHGTVMDTNFDQSSPSDPQRFEAWSPRAPRTVQPQTPGRTMIPLPPPQNGISPERERELLDRRRNWVFMTPEDYASPDGKKDALDGNDLGGKSATLMERYYQRLTDSEHAAVTNQFNKLDADQFGGRTNLVGGDLPAPGRGSFGDSPFNPVTDAGVFESIRRNDLSNPFGSDTHSALPSPEEVRVQAEQKARMENYRQIWNIDQPAVAPAAAPVSVPIDSGPLFGLSDSSMRPVNSGNSSGGNSSSSHSQTPTPIVASPRDTKPPNADFTPLQRPF